MPICRPIPMIRLASGRPDDLDTDNSRRFKPAIPDPALDARFRSPDLRQDAGLPVLSSLLEHPSMNIVSHPQIVSASPRPDIKTRAEALMDAGGKITLRLELIGTPARWNVCAKR